jgi:hypothetical protein
MSIIAMRVPLLALATTAGTIAAVSIMLSHPEALIDHSITSALAQVTPARHPQPTPHTTSGEAQLLQPSSTGAGLEGPFGLARSLAVGDRITISGRDGERRTLEVAELRSLANANRPATDGTGANFVLVTCNVLGAEPGAVVRFVIEDNDSGPPHLPATLHRAL